MTKKSERSERMKKAWETRRRLQQAKAGSAPVIQLDRGGDEVTKKLRKYVAFTLIARKVPEVLNSVAFQNAEKAVMESIGMKPNQITIDYFG